MTRSDHVSRKPTLFPGFPSVTRAYPCPANNAGRLNLNLPNLTNRLTHENASTSITAAHKKMLTRKGASLKSKSVGLSGESLLMSW